MATGRARIMRLALTVEGVSEGLQWAEKNWIIPSRLKRKVSVTALPF
jgi:hypothetical protein